MKRIIAMAAVAVLALVAFTGVADAAPVQNGQCLSVAARAGYLPQLRPSRWTFIGGTDERDGNYVDSPLNVASNSVFCGFDGSDLITLNDGWVIGGAGDDMFAVNRGTSWAVPVTTRTYINGTNQGLFIGGDGNDVAYANQGTFDGGAGNESVGYQMGTFNGGAGNDSVYFMGANAPTSVFNEQLAGDDTVDYMWDGHFDGGLGNNDINHRIGGTCTNAVVLQGPPCS